MKIPFFSKPDPVAEPETRDYTSSITAQIEQAASVTTSYPSIVYVGGLVISNAFASAMATMRPASLVNADVLSTIGLQLAVHGESVFLVRDNRLINVLSYNIQPDGRYNVNEQGGIVPASDVIHIRLIISPTTLRGIAPIDKIPHVRDTLVRLEISMAHEAGTPTGYLLPLPNDGDEATLTKLTEQLTTLAGRIALVKTTAGGWDQGREYAPRRDYMLQRLGPNFQEQNNVLYEYMNRVVLGVMGVPVELVNAAESSGAREAWRRFLHGTITPMARRVESAFMRKGYELELNFDDLFASDIAGRARAFGSLVTGGLPTDEAAAITGLVADE